ncbi:MAG TPA: DNA-directed RNA polymerase subunit alpha C-terminal domain-containing protein [Candidatus Binataceae bacterium]|nr:DNA-directed RNA polymerase subunit alpha C-terminal domain-containing protein [Candidatus Binataceae bacterium]
MGRTIQLPVIQSHPSLRWLRHDVRRHSVAAIHLSVRAKNALNQAGIRTIGDLIDHVSPRLATLRALGELSMAEIRGALWALAESVQRDGKVDWIGYARLRRFTILPEAKLSGEASPRQFLKQFPKAAAAAVESRFASEGRIVFRKYLLVSGAGSRSLDRIGERLDRTKQAAFLLKQKIVDCLKRSILDDDYTGCRFRFRSTFVRPLRELSGAMMGQDRALPYPKWTQILEKTWQVTPDDLGVLETLILELLGYKIRYSSTHLHAPVVAASKQPTSDLAAVLTTTERLLRRDFPAGLSIKDLTAKLRARGHPNMDTRKLTEFVKTISGIEENRGKFRVRLERLSRVTDQLERILQTTGHPMTSSNLAKQMEKFRGRAGAKRTTHNIGSAMSMDPRKRFTPLGRSGLWSLATWDFETGSIPDVAARLLREAGQPMNEYQLFRLIRERRPVKPKSIGKVLRDDERFRHVGPGRWDLKKR